MRIKHPWVFGLAHKDQEIMEIEVSYDGLMMRAKLEDIGVLLKLRPWEHSIRTGIVWYFNDTRDRRIARCADRLVQRKSWIEFNPQLLWQAGYEILT
jgi:hypothetical protein